MLVLAILLFLIFLFIEPISRVLNELSVLAGNRGMSDLQERLYGLYSLLATGNRTGDVGARLYLYQLSITHFINNPLLGVVGTLGFTRAQYVPVVAILNDYSNTLFVGRHSDIVDLLGGGGLIVFVPFLAIMIWFFKTVRRNAKNTESLKYVFVAYIMFFVYGLFDHSFSCGDVSFTFFVLVPMLTKLELENSLLDEAS